MPFNFNRGREVSYSNNDIDKNLIDTERGWFEHRSQEEQRRGKRARHYPETNTHERGTFFDKEYAKIWKKYHPCKTIK